MTRFSSGLAKRPRFDFWAYASSFCRLIFMANAACGMVSVVAVVFLSGGDLGTSDTSLFTLNGEGLAEGLQTGGLSL